MDKTIIFGPPGTGKTTRLMDILEDTLKTYRPEEVAFVTFTKAGAEEGKKRVISKFGYKKDDLPYFSTLHSVAYRKLGLKRDDVINRKHYKLFSQALGMQFTGYYTEDLLNDDDKYLFFNELYRNNKKAAKKILNQLNPETLKYVRDSYISFKHDRKSRLYDYTDMIEGFIETNEALPVKVAIIDEAQDLTTLQWRMTLVAFRDCEKMYIAGDDDQAIYQWNGADVEHFLSINCKHETLEKSHRLPDNLVKYATHLVKNIAPGNRITKEYTGNGTNGKIVNIKSLDEVQFNTDESWMILARNTYHLASIEEHLRYRGILYRDKKKDPSATKQKMDLIRMYEWCNKNCCMTTEQEIKLTPHLTPGYDLRDHWYEAFNWSERDIMYYRDIIKNGIPDFNKKINIRVSTIHSVKGEEADNVIVLADMTKRVHHSYVDDPDPEHRVFYVAVTRAKKALYLLEGYGKYEYLPLYDRGDLY
jgi:DNA helicase-2/ATP-dependent DNA helicase PcrA